MTLYRLILLSLIFSFNQVQAQESDSIWQASTFKGLEFRSIGPSLMAGRIADIAIHSMDQHTWYVAVGSGGVWKTTNSGTTWTPLFDEQSSYSIGCVTIDPHDPFKIWVGTGENIGGRHVGYGDGIYLSPDGGKTWKNMGLKESQHISMIIVHPEKEHIIWVVAQGPLWSEGGERGVYRSEDSGETWTQVLGNDQWTGATDLVMDPRNPDVLYAATWDRHRTVAAYLGGGPGTGIYKSTDGGLNWKELKSGLPESNMGKIGLAISPQNPDHIYAAIELNHRKGGIYKSVDGGMNWEKRSNTVSGATGPHYYQELYASPHKYDRLYLADNNMQITEDGGKTWRRMNEKYKHGDNHALAFRDDDPDYLLVGSDGGLYESFDLGKNWRFIENMPITQFYKIAVDDSEPFYNVYGGTQGGPSRTDNAQGIQNSDWKIVLNWDGHQPATEPGNRNIMYGQRQEGTLSRIDLATGEVIDIQPQPGKDEGFERFNWDAPILVSPHSPTTIFFGSHRLWKSDNRGDSWTAISDDLTRNENRVELPIMGRQQSWDNAWDLYAMSTYNTLTSIAESPLIEGLIYTGTDDGLIHVTEDGGENWREIRTEFLPGAPERAYVNDIKADIADAGTVYVALSHHKAGDFSPYLYQSTDRGLTWSRLGSDLPERNVIWRLVQDHVDPDLLFLGTEFGIFCSVNGGDEWFQLKGGLPTISFRDLAIQRRENDLVAGSFGRSIYILDDYTCLREISEGQLKTDASIFPVRDAWWYFPRPHLSFGSKKGSQGNGHFVADNPPFGAVFTYYLPEGLHSSEEERKKKEEEIGADEDIPFPGWDSLAMEMYSAKPEIIFEIRTTNGKMVRRIKGPVSKGFHRVAWDLRYSSSGVVDLDQPEKEPSTGLMAPPGEYIVEMYQVDTDKDRVLIGTQSFEVKTLHTPTLEGMPMDEVSEFWRSYEKMSQQRMALSKKLKNVENRIKATETALITSDIDNSDLFTEIKALQMAINDVDLKLNGNPAKRLPGEKTKPTIAERMSSINRGVGRSRYGPTQGHLQNVEIVQEAMNEITRELKLLDINSMSLAERVYQQGGPWIEGLPLPERE